MTFRNPPNFEAPADANRNNEYRVTVRANDGAATGTTAVKVTVTDVNEPPAFPDATATLTIAENTAAGRNIGGRIVAADPDRDSALTYTLGGRNAASFAIVAASGQLQTKAGLNYEARDSYTVTVSVSDGKNARGNADTRTDDSITVTINVTNRNEPPGEPAAPTVTAGFKRRPHGPGSFLAGADQHRPRHYRLCGRVPQAGRGELARRQRGRLRRSRHD